MVSYDFVMVDNLGLISIYLWKYHILRLMEKYLSKSIYQKHKFKKCGKALIFFRGFRVGRVESD